MSLANRLWGAPRIHGELLKLGVEVAQSTVAKYMARSGRGGGADGYRGNVRSVIKRIRSKFRSLDPTFDEIENYNGFGYCWKKPD